MLRARDFAGAAEAFAAAGDDPPSAVMRKRALGYQQAPPPEDWDGVFRRTSK
jgi:hypothetical protein